MLDDFKKNLLLDLIAAEIKNVNRGDSVYGDAADQFDTLTALNELHEELTRTGKLTGEDPEEVREENLISHGAGSAKYPMVGLMQAGWVVNVQGDNHGDIVM